MPGRNFFTIIRPGHYPDKFPQRKRNRSCITNSSQPSLLKANSVQLQRHLKPTKTLERKARFRVKVQNGGQVIADEPGLCGNCHLVFQQIRTHLRKCHPRLYRRFIVALRNARPVAQVNPPCSGDVKEPSTNEQQKTHKSGS